MNQELTAVIPLESNPDVFDKFAYTLGLDTSYNFNDIFSISEPELLDFLPRPMVAIVLLFPIQKVKPPLTDLTECQPKTPIWLRQNIQNACGLYALLHILVNNRNLLRGKDVSPLVKYMTEKENEDIVRQSGNIDKFIVDFIQANKETFESSSGDSVNPNPDDLIDLHFISFISFDNKLWELDGRSNLQRPLYLGDVENSNSIANANNDIDLISEPTVLNRIKSYMNNVENENDKLNFSLLGLSKSWD